MRYTKACLVIGLALGLAVLMPIRDAEAHGNRSRIGISFGYGYPYYSPFYGYRSYYGYYPRSYIGFSAWPRYRSTRVRKREEQQVRNQALYIYPAEGQTDEQLADDRYECHVWAADSSDFDPTLGAGTREEANDYARALTACMEGRGYVVR